MADPNFDIQFERRVLLRTLPDGTIDPVHPRGLLLRSDPSADVALESSLRVEDEEIPRAGTIVTRAYEYTRWYGGTSFLWMGRAKRTGRGEARARCATTPPTRGPERARRPGVPMSVVGEAQCIAVQGVARRGSTPGSSLHSSVALPLDACAHVLPGVQAAADTFARLLRGREDDR